jgi:hypothetical protein
LRQNGVAEIPTLTMASGTEALGLEGLQGGIVGVADVTTPSATVPQVNGSLSSWLTSQYGGGEHRPINFRAERRRPPLK